MALTGVLFKMHDGRCSIRVSVVAMIPMLVLACFLHVQHEFVDRDALDPILMVPLIRVLEVRPGPPRTSISEEADDEGVEAREKKVSDKNIVERKKMEGHVGYE